MKFNRFSGVELVKKELYIKKPRTLKWYIGTDLFLHECNYLNDLNTYRTIIDTDCAKLYEIKDIYALFGLGYVLKEMTDELTFNLPKRPKKI